MRARVAYREVHAPLHVVYDEHGRMVAAFPDTLEGFEHASALRVALDPVYVKQGRHRADG